MKGNEMLLEAMALVDPALVEDARAERRIRRMGRRVLTAALAAALTLALAGTAAAAHYGDWFTGYFAEKTDGALTAGQQAAVKAMTAVVGQSRTADGWTVTVDQAIAARDNAYIKLDVTAPTGTDLDPEKLTFDCEEVRISGFNTPWTSDEGVMSTCMQMEWIKEADAAENEGTILLELDRNATGDSELSLADGRTRTLTIEDLRVWGPGEKQPLAEGTWRFRFVLPPAQEVELLAEPVSVWVRQPEEKTREEVRLTSLRLTALGASCEYTAPGEYIREFDDIRLVLADGTAVTGRERSNGARGFGKAVSFAFDVPVDLAQADYVQVQGVKLPLPD